MSKLIQYQATLDCEHIPEVLRKSLDNYMQENRPDNGSYHKFYLDEYREQGFEVSADYYGLSYACFMQWLEPQTTARCVLILYWW